MKHFCAALLLSFLPAMAQAANYGAFLDAQYAASQGRMGIAASSILAALNADPDNNELQRDAFGLTPAGRAAGSGAPGAGAGA